MSQLDLSRPLSAAATYCNPLSLPDYPRGYACRREPIPDYRESADPTVLYHEGIWYLFSSCGMAYYSTDFANWQHVDMVPNDIGYAPTVVLHGGKFYMTASGNPEVWVADKPLGPYTLMGTFVDTEGNTPFLLDPMLFSDDDGRLYIYWGGGSPIYGAELDAEDPRRFLTPPKELMRFNPEHIWERIGECNEDCHNSFIEGAWMFKWNGEYYLTYAGPGTEFDTYSMGAYRGKSPLGPFTYARHNPFLTKRTGLVRGPGHGSVVEGPGGTLWAFYTCTVCYAHNAERRIGMDPLGIDENGDLYVREATEIPQLAPGTLAAPQEGNGAGLIPFTFRRPTKASSQAPGRDPLYATDDSMLSFWQPAEGDSQPWLQVSTAIWGGASRFTAYSARIIWREVGLDYDNGVLPGPVQYIIECSEDGQAWETVLDASENLVDMTVDYRPAQRLIPGVQFRLRILSWPQGITPAVINFTLFGVCED